MDDKQKHIFRRILDKNSLPHENVFMQYRNLKEFKSFFIERINPTHRIELYGRLKRSNVKDNNFNKAIKAGEILICMGFLMFAKTWLLNVSINILMGIILFDIVLGLITVDVNRNRREYRNGQNSLSCALP